MFNGDFQCTFFSKKSTVHWEGGILFFFLVFFLEKKKEEKEIPLKIQKLEKLKKW